MNIFLFIAFFVVIMFPTNGIADEGEKTISFKAAFILEQELRSTVGECPFCVGIRNLGAKLEKDRERIHAGFLTEMRGSFFVVTAGHVIANREKPFEPVLVIGDGEKRRNVPFDAATCAVFALGDLAVCEIPKRLLREGDAAVAPLDIKAARALKGDDVLVVMCNPRRFVDSPRPAFFVRNGYKSSIYGSRLLLKFPGIMSKSGCSGSPVLNREGNVVGVHIARGGRTSFANSAVVIKRFLTHAFGLQN